MDPPTSKSNGNVAAAKPLRSSVVSDLRSSTIDGPATDGGGGALGLTSDLIAPWMDRQTDLGFRFTAGFPLHIDRR
jgi:hypothetical protein